MGLWHRTPRRRSRREPLFDAATVLKIRLGMLRTVTVLLLGVLLFQLWRLQIVEGSRYRQRAEYNRLRMLSIPAPRGVIYDRNGRLLARNLPSFTIAIVPADLPEDPQGTIARLSTLLHIPAEEITERLEERRQQQSPFLPVPIATNLEHEQALILSEQLGQLPGALVQVEQLRSYPEGELMSHLLGYVGRISAKEYQTLRERGYELNDRLGKTGVELTYEEFLRGKPGKEVIETDARGRKLATIYREEPEPGGNLVLTIDLDLQQRMAQYLQEVMGPSKYAAGIALSPKTGAILAMVSLPSYDNNMFSRPITRQELATLLEDPRSPLLNHVIGGAYPPGSIFKLVTGAAALQEGVAQASTQIVSTGAITVRSEYDPDVVYTFEDWAALGSLDFVRAIALSSDVYFYYLAGGYERFQGLGVERLARYARQFGLGERTGVALSGETTGLVPDATWKRRGLREVWLKGDTYLMGIGQGYLQTTPLQMANVVAAVANGGILWEPQIVRSVVAGDGKPVVPFTRKVLREVGVKPQHLALLREGMRESVRWGVARPAAVPGVEIGGKTGTAEFGPPNQPKGQELTHGWFMGFAPYEDPEVAVVIFHERGRGNTTGAPTAGKFLQYYFARKTLVGSAQESHGAVARTPSQGQP